MQFRPLDVGDDRAAFSCGVPPLDDWFHARAGQDQRRNVARVYVAVDDLHGIVGFYSLSTLSIVGGDLPETLARKLPRYGEVPAILIGRLARDLRVRGNGVGELLLADAVARILDISREIGVYVIVVDAKDAAASDFYMSFGFQPFPSNPMRLFLPIATAHASQIAAQVRR
jgi:GNAT superfamily N-acetyltransferase